MNDQTETLQEREIKAHRVTATPTAVAAERARFGVVQPTSLDEIARLDRARGMKELREAKRRERHAREAARKRDWEALRDWEAAAKALEAAGRRMLAEQEREYMAAQAACRAEQERILAQRDTSKFFVKGAKKPGAAKKPAPLNVADRAEVRNVLRVLAGQQEKPTLATLLAKAGIP